MAVLGKIRKRSGLLLIAIGGAMIAFVLSDQLGPGGGGPTNTDPIGEIAGETITRTEFDNKVRELTERQERQGTPVDNDMVRQTAWSQIVDKTIMDNQYDAIGLGVHKEELIDQLFGSTPHQYVRQFFTDRTTGQVLENFADQFGRLDPNKVKQYHSQIHEDVEDDEQRQQLYTARMEWYDLQDAVERERLRTKFFNLVKKGLYIPDTQAKNHHIAQNKKADINFLAQKYATVSDTTISVSEGDLESYYADHKINYQRDAVRNIEYIVFEIFPTSDDTAYHRNYIQELKTGLMAADNDTLFIRANTDSRADIAYKNDGDLPQVVDTIAFSADTGTVVGPYIDGGAFKLSKIMGKRTRPDSAMVRHILLGHVQTQQPLNERTKARASELADSLKQVLKSDTSKFRDLVKEFSDDAGSLELGGNYGWIQEGRMVPPFESAAFDSTVGDIVIAESMFGYHIIEILNQAKTKHEQVLVGTMDRLINASDKTYNQVFQRAVKFAGRNRTGEEFNNSAKEENLNVRTASLGKDDRVIPGLQAAREIVKWAFNAEEGDVSELLGPFDNKYVVAHLTEAIDEGPAPLALVREEIEAEVRKEKKAEKFRNEFSTAMQGTVSLQEIGNKLNLPVDSANELTFASSYIAGVANEPAVIGVSFALPEGELSQPIKGQTGVFVIKVVKTRDLNISESDIEGAQKQLMNRVQQRVDYELVEAMKKAANIEDNRLQYY